MKLPNDWKKITAKVILPSLILLVLLTPFSDFLITEGTIIGIEEESDGACRIMIKSNMGTHSSYENDVSDYYVGQTVYLDYLGVGANIEYGEMTDLAKYESCVIAIFIGGCISTLLLTKEIRGHQDKKENAKLLRLKKWHKKNKGKYTEISQSDAIERDLGMSAYQVRELLKSGGSKK